MTSSASPATDSLLARLESEARAVLDRSGLGASTLPSIERLRGPERERVEEQLQEGAEKLA